MIETKTYPQLPPKVEYSLTEIGYSLMPVTEAMNQWGDANRSSLENVIKQTPKINDTSKTTCLIYKPITKVHKIG